MSLLVRKPIRSAAGLLVLLFAAAAYAQENKDLDAYKWRIDGSWWFSNPSGYVHGANNNGTFDFNRDIGFGSYSTFSGKVDWHFKRKHHLIVRIAPVTSERTVTLSNQIEFEGVTYDVGAQVSADLNSFSISPGYQYDFIRRNHGYLGGVVQMYLINTKSSLTGIGSVNGESAVRTASGSVFAPIPTLGVQGRWYPMHDSNRLALDGDIQGMYFFGYGDFFSTRALLVINVYKHLSAIAGYELGTDLSVHGTNDRIGLRLTQKGPVLGIQGNW